MTKRKTWKQNKPTDQYRVIIMSLEGHYSNFVDGIIDNQKAIKKVGEAIQELRDLLPFIEDPTLWNHR